MTSDLAQRMQAVAKRAQQAPSPVRATELGRPVEHEPAREAERTHRITVDLGHDQYMALREQGLRWLVTISAIMRSLLAELAEDEELAERVRQRAAAG